MRLKPTTAESLLPEGAPRLGFGCGDIYGGASFPISARLIEAAYDAGVRYFDTARLYGDGSAEGVLGAVLAGRRDKVVVAGKAGILPWSMQWGARFRTKAAKLARRHLPYGQAIVPPPPAARERYGAFKPSQLRRSVEASLRALRTDYLDVLLLHECEIPDATRPETLSLLEKLRRDGKVRALGVATQPATTAEILKMAPAAFEVAQFASDALNRHVERVAGPWPGLTITHSAVSAALPRLRARVMADPALAAAWRSAFDAAPEDAESYAALLLQDALAAHAGMVLFSTSRVERIGAAVAAAGSVEPARLQRFRQIVASTRLSAAA